MKNENYIDQMARLFPPGKDNCMARTVTFAVTDDCNLRCSYCYQGRKNKNVLSFGTAKKFMDLILSEDNEYYTEDNTPAVILEFIGGEPFLEIDLMDQITNYFIHEMIRLRHRWLTRFMISICSNGVLYFQPKVQAYIKKHLSHLSFSVTIDGNKALHDSCRVFPDGRGSYDRAIKAVEHYTQVLKGYMGSKITLCPENIGHISDAIIDLIEFGYRDIYVNCVYEKGWELPHAAALYKEFRRIADYLMDNELYNDIYLSMFEKHFFRPKDSSDVRNWCGGTGDMISVDYTGNIYPCIRYMPNSLGEGVKPLTIGHVDTGIMKEDCHRNCVDCLRKIDRRTQSTDECFDCPIAEGCSWCSAYNYQVFGTPDKRATFICVMHKARALANAYFWNTLYRREGSEKRHVMHIPDEWALGIIDHTELDLLKKLVEYPAEGGEDHQ